MNPGTGLAVCSIFGGSLGVTLGGYFSDLVGRKLGTHSRLWFLSACLVREIKRCPFGLHCLLPTVLTHVQYLFSPPQLCATPLAVGVLLLEPPSMFYALFVYYFFCKGTSGVTSCGGISSLPPGHISAETWFAVLFTAILEIVHPEVRSVVIGIFVFFMTNVGGNLPVLIDPLMEKTNYRTALMIFFPGLVGASKSLSGEGGKVNQCLHIMHTRTSITRSCCTQYAHFECM